jgi:hypothetical protein
MIVISVVSLEEESLAERAVTLVARVEPLADARYVELVFAVLARHSREALVGRVQDAVADETLLDALYLFVDVALPEEDCGDDVAITNLQEIPDSEGPLVLLAL